MTSDHQHFLQSLGWDQFQKDIGRDVWRIDEMLVVKIPLLFDKSYFYAAGVDRRIGAGELDGIRHIARDEGVIFLKVEPMSELHLVAAGLGEAGFARAPKAIQPQQTRVLDLTQSEDDLLARMHTKTRYNIRLAERHDIIVRRHPVPTKSEADIFLQLLAQTIKRDQFFGHQERYYRRMLKIPFVELFIAEKDGTPLAASIIAFFGEVAYYLHGASDHNQRQCMAPFALHWEVMREAKRRGFQHYDLWGTDERRWPGVTRFKQGFGGKEVNYVGSFDYVFQSWWYRLYQLKQFLRS